MEFAICQNILVSKTSSCAGQSTCYCRFLRRYGDSLANRMGFPAVFSCDPSSVKRKKIDLDTM